VPNNSLLFRPAGTMVAVVDSNNRIDLKKLTIGRDLGTSVEVLAGITANQEFILNPPDAIDQGQQVTISQPSAAPR